MPTAPATDPRHMPVLLDEAMAFLAPRAGGIYCDATVGLGGHASALLERSAPDGRLVGIDRDELALSQARQRLAGFGERCTLLHGRFSSIRSLLSAAGVAEVDGCLVDLGVSSMQLDQGERGFSFRYAGPLDMRMDASQGQTAADLVSDLSEGELEQILRDLGEERFARKIAAAIVEARRREPLTSTDALASLVAKTVPRHERNKDPATRTFQALRMAVNDELGEIERFLGDAPGCLRPGGRLVVISFHSLEDRMVKRSFRALAGKGTAEPASVRMLTKHVVTASDDERRRNPRSRSAKLRAIERLAS